MHPAPLRDRCGSPPANGDLPSPRPTASGTARSLRTAAPVPAPNRCPEYTRTTITPPTVADRSHLVLPALPWPGSARRTQSGPASPPPPLPSSPHGSAPRDRPGIAPPSSSVAVQLFATAPQLLSPRPRLSLPCLPRSCIHLYPASV